MGDGDGRTVTADMIAGAAFLLGTDKETAKTLGSVVAFLLGVAARRVR